jgi:hypothetical protein
MTKTVGMLEIELDEARRSCARAELEGAELALGYQQLLAKKDEEIEALKGSRKRAADDDCARCRRLRTALLVSTTTLLCSLWWLCVAQNTKATASTKRETVIMLLVPALLYWMDKKRRQFKRRVAWLGLRDNDVYRHIQERWNGGLDRMRMG